MTIREAIAYVDETFPNTFGNEIKTKWIAQLEQQIISGVMLLDPRDYQTYTWAYDADRELIVPDAYAELYTLYLEARLYLAYHEASNYQNTMQLFNGQWGEFVCWYADTYDPASMPPPLRPRPTPVETQVQGETITIAFSLPYDSSLLGTLQVVLVCASQQLVYDVTSLTLDGSTATLVLAQETTIDMPTGIWNIYVIGTDTNGVRFESHEPMVMRIIDTKYPGVIQNAGL